jgi:hypothetical protein
VRVGYLNGDMLACHATLDCELTRAGLRLDARFAQIAADVGLTSDDDAVMLGHQASPASASRTHLKL